jgi:hypothetical protein
LGPFFVSLCASHTFFLFSWPGCQTLVKQNLKKKKKIVYNLCLTQNNSQKALQKKEKRNIDIC